MARLQTPSPEDTIEVVLDLVDNVREEVVAIERKLERLRVDLAKLKHQRNGHPKKT
jgi:hypothetical protein